MMLKIANWFKLSAAITLKSGVSIVQTMNCSLNRNSAAVQYVITVYICNNYFQKLLLYFFFAPISKPGMANKQNTPHILKVVGTDLEEVYKKKKPKHNVILDQTFNEVSLFYRHADATKSAQPNDTLQPTCDPFSKVNENKLHSHSHCKGKLLEVFAQLHLTISCCQCGLAHIQQKPFI